MDDNNNNSNKKDNNDNKKKISLPRWMAKRALATHSNHKSN